MRPGNRHARQLRANCPTENSRQIDPTLCVPRPFIRRSAAPLSLPVTEHSETFFTRPLPPENDGRRALWESYELPLKDCEKSGPRATGSRSPDAGTREIGASCEGTTAHPSYRSSAIAGGPVPDRCSRPKPPRRIAAGDPLAGHRRSRLEWHARHHSSGGCRDPGNQTARSARPPGRYLL